MKTCHARRECVSILFFSQFEGDLSLLSSFNEPYYVYEWLLIPSKKLRRRKRPFTVLYNKL